MLPVVHPPPVALTIAGSDCCAGAGLQADLKTFSAFGVHGLTAVTSVVAETPLAVHGIYPVSPAALQEQIRILLQAYPVAAIKTGMLGSAPLVVAVADLLSEHAIPLVVDPVMVASTGDSLLASDAISAFRDRLVPLATVLTPNLPEARALSRRPGPPTAASLAEELGRAVLLTGGHESNHQEAVDVLAADGQTTEFRSPWIEIPSSHGTGCTLSAAIAANLARGEPLASAVGLAKAFLMRALRESYAWSRGEESPELRAINQLPPTTFPRS